MPRPLTRVAIVADDLTGVLDTAGQWARLGVRTLVMLDAAAAPAAWVVGMHTASRAISPELARGRAKEVAQRLQDHDVYKKVDSTLRGNIGAEVEGLLDGLGLHRALIAPAFPAAGRTVRAGILRVHGTPLALTEFAHDPQWPARESHAPALLAGQTRRRVGHLPLEVVARGEAAIRQALSDCDAEWVVADAVEEEHLHALARAAAQMPQTWLCCGSAGLAEGWLSARGLARPVATPFRWAARPGPVLVVAGSRHPATARQLHRAQEQRGLRLVHLALEDRPQPSEVVSWLADGRHVALTTAFSPHQPGAEARTAAHMARAVAWACNAGEARVSGLILTGGDTADAVCTVLGMAGLQVVGEVQPGIPASAGVGGPSDGLRVVTKAGGFGDDNALVRCMDFVLGAGGASHGER